MRREIQFTPPRIPNKHYSANVLTVLRSVIHTYELIQVCI